MSANFAPVVVAAMEKAREQIEIAVLTRYISVVGFVVVLYDYLLCLDDEKRLIWPAKLSLVKFLYVFVRVSTILGLGFANFHLAGFRPSLSNNFCQYYGISTALLEVLSVACANWLMMLRVCALYGGKKKVVWPLYALFIVAYIACFTLVGLSFEPIFHTLRYSPMANMCVGDTKERGYLFIFGSPFVLEAVIFFMTAYKAYEQARIVSSQNQGRFIHVLTRDGLSYHAIMFIIRIWNMWSYAALPVNYLYMSIYTLWAVVSVLTLRVLLNLRNVANPRDWDAEMDVAVLNPITSSFCSPVTATSLGYSPDDIFTPVTKTPSVLPIVTSGLPKKGSTQVHSLSPQSPGLANKPKPPRIDSRLRQPISITITREERVVQDDENDGDSYVMQERSPQRDRSSRMISFLPPTSLHRGNSTSSSISEYARTREHSFVDQNDTNRYDRPEYHQPTDRTSYPYQYHYPV